MEKKNANFFFFFLGRRTTKLCGVIITLSIVPGVCIRSTLEFRDQEHGNMPRIEMEKSQQAPFQAYLP